MAKTFEEKLKEVLREYRESEESYERWLRELGIDRDVLHRLAEGPGKEKNRDMRQIFEKVKQEVDDELGRMRTRRRGKRAAGEILTIPAWAIKV